jgi:hypothetical protein
MSDHQPGPVTAAVSWGADRIDLFTVADDRSLVHRSFDGRSWSESTSLGGSAGLDTSGDSLGGR